MKTSELRTRSVAELQDELVLSQKELFHLRMGQRAESGESEDPPRHRQRILRRRIACLKTILNEKRLV